MEDRRVVLVTGASGGLGAAVACWLGRAGAAVVLTARREERLGDVAAEVRRLGGEAECLPADLTHAETCFRLVEDAVARFGRLDGLVNNAGVIEPIAPLTGTNPEEWGRNLQINLLSPYYMMRFALPELRKRSGRLVNVSSGAALKPMAGWSAYCTAKAGLLHLTRVVAEECREVVAVSLRPGVVDTEMQEVIRRQGPGGMDPERAAHFQRLKDEGGLLPPEVPARSAAWLALHAPRDLSGEMVQHDDPRVTEPARKAWGESLA